MNKATNISVCRLLVIAGLGGLLYGVDFGVLAARLAEGEALEAACLAANDAAGYEVTVRYVLPAIPRRTRV